MAVNINLSRNTKVYFTTNLGPTLHGDHNTTEIQVLNGYTFSQGTEQETIQLSEAGATPNRGQRSFNSKLNPVEWGFTTYVRPKKYSNTNGAMTMTANPTVVYTTVAGIVTNAEATITAASGSCTAIGSMTPLLYTISGFTNGSTALNTTTAVQIHRLTNTTFKLNVPASHTGTTLTGTATFTAATAVACPESCLWNAMASPNPYVGSSVTAAWSPAATASSLVMTNSNIHQLAPFALIFKIDKVIYKVAGCALNQAEINFGIDQIAQIAWSGFGTGITKYETTDTIANEIASLTPADTAANYITNKLSVISLGSGLNAATTSSNGLVLSTATPTYSVAITGGALTINNNLNYLTPENLGVVNNTIGYFTGTRAISGNLTAYLKTGGAGAEATESTGALLAALQTGANTSTDNKYSMVINVGGINTTRVEFLLDGVMLQVPSVEVQDVVSTTLNFTGQGTDGVAHPGGAFDVTASNELKVIYRSA